MRHLFFLTIMAASVVQAQPIIFEVQGTFEHGLSVTIFGSGFGVKDPAAPIVWCDYSEGLDSIGEDIPLGEGTPHNWELYGGSFPRPHYSDVWYHSAGVSQRNGGLRRRLIEIPDGATELYMTAWQYVAHHPDVTGNWKNLRLGPSPTTGGVSHSPYHGAGTHIAPNPTIQTYAVPETGAIGFSAGGQGWYHYMNSAGDNLDPGYWCRAHLNYPMRQELWAKKASAPGAADGEYYHTKLTGLSPVWYAPLNNYVPGSSAVHRTNVDNYRTGHEWTFGAWLVMGFNTNQVYNGTNIGGNQDHPYYGHAYTDDVYLDITRARVEIGNHVNFTSCTMREIQIPITWASDEVSVRVNHNIFHQNEQVYLFIIDANGVPSAGFPVNTNMHDLGIPGPPSGVNFD